MNCGPAFAVENSTLSSRMMNASTVAPLIQRVPSNKRNYKAKLQQETHCSQDKGKHSSMDPQRLTSHVLAWGETIQELVSSPFQAKELELQVVGSQLPWLLRIKLGPRGARQVLLNTDSPLLP